MAPQTFPPISEPRTGYTAVLGCAFAWLDITLAGFPQVCWQGFSANRITVLKPSTMQPATDNLVWIHWDSPSFCITVPSQQLVFSLWKRLMGLDWGLSKTLWSFFPRSEYSSIRTLPREGWRKNPKRMIKNKNQNENPFPHPCSSCRTMSVV